MDFYRLISVLVAAAMGSSAIAQDATSTGALSPDEIIRHLELSRDQVSNAEITSIWTSEMEGQSPVEELQVFIWDDLGRRRIISTAQNAGSGDARESDTTFDGEIIAYSKIYDGLNQDGMTPQPNEALGYNPVIIGDAASPLVTDLVSQRNPLEYVRNAALPLLVTALKEERVAVQPHDESSLLELRISHDKVPVGGIHTTNITVDPAHGWQILSVRGLGDDGSLLSEIETSYREQSDGVWMPTKGTHTIWKAANRDKPFLRWAFDVRDSVFNNPRFDESLFEIRLRPGAAVSDTRFNVTYRVGQEELLAEGLTAHAKEARRVLNEQQAALRTGRGLSARDAASSRLRQVVLALNVLVVLSLIVYFFFRNVASRR
jgi:hypothetical protein